MTARRRLARCLAGVLATLAVTAPSAAAAVPAEGAAVSAYEGLAAWVDMFDKGPWQRPERAVRRWSQGGVGTVFVQTSNYRRTRALYRPRDLARLVSTAHHRGLKVVAWYLPGFEDLARDWRRVRAAVSYRTPDGHRFDGFAMDIEATAVRRIAVRNRRMLSLSRRLRRLVGSSYAIGAIIPDPVTQRYWPRFPYAAVRSHYDAILPMSYWTAHTRGERRAYRHTRSALRIIRRRTGDPSVPVHVIGGIASHASAAEVRGFTRASLAHGAAGASLYDAAVTTGAQWRQLARIAR